MPTMIIDECARKQWYRKNETLISLFEEVAQHTSTSSEKRRRISNAATLSNTPVIMTHNRHYLMETGGAFLQYDWCCVPRSNYFQNEYHFPWEQ